MRRSCILGLQLLIAPALTGCVQLPALDFHVRSTWRARPEQHARAVELLAGVLLGWSGGGRAHAPIEVPGQEDLELDARSRAYGDDVAPCFDAELCRWEHDERSAALERSATLELP
jgi:hypothetical protein